MGYSMRLATTVSFALVLSAAIIFLAAGWPGGLRQAEAQTVGAAPTTEEKLILENIARATEVADEARARGETPTASMVEEQAKARRVISRAGRAKIPALSKTLITRGNLATIAAGIWIHNGVTLYCGLEAENCAKPVVLDGKFKQAEGSPGFIRTYSSDGSIYMAGVLDRVDYSATTNNGGDCTVTASWTVQPTQNRISQYSTFGYLRTFADRSGVYGNCKTIIDLLYQKADAPQSASRSQLCPATKYPHRTVVQLQTQSGPGPTWSYTNLFNTDPCAGTGWENPVYDWGATEEGGQPGPNEIRVPPAQSREFGHAIKTDPEYDPSWAKPWLREDFRAPSDPQQREALWGPAVGTWTTPGGGVCKEFDSGAKLCDSPNGSTFAWIVRDSVAWMQYPDGNKNWMARPGQRSTRTTPEGSGTTTLYRVIEPAELQDVEQLGDYGLSPHGGGKYFATTEQGARDFANTYLNRDRELTLTSVEVPNVFLRENGYDFNDPGGAGWSYHFGDEELAEMYEVMGPVKILGQAN